MSYEKSDGLERVSGAPPTIFDNEFLAAIAAGPDTRLATQQDFAVTRRANLEEYESWYNANLLPQHEQVWASALGALAAFGRELHYTGNYRCGLHATVSTGLLAVETQELGNFTLASAIRLSNTSDTNPSSPGLNHKLAKAQRTGAPVESRGRAVAALDSLLRPNGITVEAFMVANSAHLLDAGKVVAKEVQYPKSLLQRSRYEFEGVGSKSAEKALQQHPDVNVYAESKWVLPHWPNNHPNCQSHLPAPSLFVPEGLKRGSFGYGYENAQADALAYHGIIDALDTLFTHSLQPVRDIEAFKHVWDD